MNTRTVDWLRLIKAGSLALILAPLLLIQLFTGCTGGGVDILDGSVDGGLGEEKKIVILCAFAPELKALVDGMAVESTDLMLGRTVYMGKIAGREVALVASGISEANAAMMAQAMITRFNPQAIIFSGVAGAISPEMHVSDVLIATEWAQYQEQVMAHVIPGGYDPRGANEEILFENFDMFFPLQTCFTTVGGAPDVEECRFWFPVDSRLMDIAKASVSTITLERCKPGGECLLDQPKVHIGGYAVSGPSFMDNETYRVYLWDTFKVQAVDRESAVVAHVAKVNGVPFIAFRAISDLAGHPVEYRQFANFADFAAKNVTKVLVTFLGKLN